MIVITKDRVAECNELILSENEIIAYIENCPGCHFNALVCVNTTQAKTVFSEVKILIKQGATVIDFTAFNSKIDLTALDPKDDTATAKGAESAIDAPIRKVGIMKALRIVRNRQPLGRFYFVKKAEDGDRYIAIDNIDGQAYCEAFDDEAMCKKWLRGE